MQKTEFFTAEYLACPSRDHVMIEETHGCPFSCIYRIPIRFYVQECAAWKDCLQDQPDPCISESAHCNSYPHQELNIVV